MIYFSLKKENDCVLISLIPKLLKTNNQESGCLINTYNEFISHIKRREGIDYTSGTIRHHETNRNHLKQFISQHYQISDVPLTTLRYDFIVDYETFLYTEFGNKLNTIEGGISYTEARTTPINLRRYNIRKINEQREKQQGRTKESIG